jgi:hypothetical protein
MKANFFVWFSEGTALPAGSNFSLVELEIATDNYKQLLGRGGFGEVFYGQLPSGKEVAVKKLVSGSQQGAEEFFNEVCNMAYIPYVVSLLLMAKTNLHCMFFRSNCFSSGIYKHGSFSFNLSIAFLVDFCR